MRQACAVLIGVLFSICCSGADGGVMLAPVIATTDMGTSSGSGSLRLRNAFNQSGLRTSFVSGVTPSSYTSLHDNSASNIFVSRFRATGFVSFDLGSEYQVTGLRLWNAIASVNGKSASIKDFLMFADNDLDPTNGGMTTLGSFTAISQSGVQQMQSFSINSTTQYLHLNVASNHGDAIRSGFGEIAFTAAAVPEPGSLAVFGTICLVGMVRRRQS